MNSHESAYGHFFEENKMFSSLASSYLVCQCAHTYLAGSPQDHVTVYRVNSIRYYGSVNRGSYCLIRRYNGRMDVADTTTMQKQRRVDHERVLEQ